MNFHVRVIWCALLAAPALPSRPFAQERHCPIHVDAKDIYAYQSRGNRCEGIIARPAGGELIRFIGLTQSVEDFNPQLGADLHVVWPQVAADSIWLKAVGVRAGLFYQMDTALPKTSTEFRWPVTVLLKEGVRRADVAVRGWTIQSFGGIPDTVLIPIALWQQRAASFTNTEYVMTILPVQRMRALRFGIATADASGRSDGWFREMTAVPGTDFLEGSAVRIPLGKISAPGLYIVQVAADLWSTTAASGDIAPKATARALVRISQP
ncbi:MAG: hypothetical protein ABJB66_16195 [Gemmatimonadaceae bacterium]